ncbi:dihydroxy-acid dehydratase [Purpureocillium lavendulum]|uniref:Dihydroxy-acid dehydratase n=1 Tax=Purpureocillium lavendulum TaxID=1247861 RepID=A0AB34FH03_9HYPO|nr:dihydroxy-acid dehydratase [Purpureocillium lavendulum]
MLPKPSSVWRAAVAAVIAVSSLTLAQQHIPVTGAPVPQNGQVPLRLEINDMQAKGGAAWDLFLLSLRAMYGMDAYDQRSWFQIAGIHGKPYVQWNNAGPRRATGWAGYCPHGEKIFLPWHRPYLALFEQELVRHATQLAAGYPAQYRAEYTAAAATLRLPYWDWAADQTVPSAIVPRSVTVRVPSGNGLRQSTIENPLATYRYPSAALVGRFGVFDEQGRNQIALRMRPYRQWVYDALTQQTTFNGFATTATTGVGMEQIHNAIHWDAACTGQFFDPSLTGFDFLFILHHANVDRIWAYYGITHRDSVIFNDTYRGLSRYGTPAGTPLDNRSPMEPFFQRSGSFHTSLSVLSVFDFGYTYAGLESGKSETQMRQDVTRFINQRYGPRQAAAAKPMFMATAGGENGTHDKEGDRPGSRARFFVDLAIDRAEVDRPCSVNVYRADTAAGSMVLPKEPESGISNGGFTIDDVSLKVDIRKRDGSKIALGSVPSLKLEVLTPVKNPNRREIAPAARSACRPNNNAMGFDIVVPTAEEASAISDIHLRAMDNNALTHAQFPGAAAMDFFRGWLDRNTLQQARDAHKGVLVARDADTGEVASFIKWLVHESGTDESAAKDLEPFSEPCNVQLLNSYGELTERMRKQAMGTKPYCRELISHSLGRRRYAFATRRHFRWAHIADATIDVTFLCTDPKWGGRGAASTLLRHVQERAAAEGMAIILEATMEGVRLYQKLGFAISQELHMKLPSRGSTQPTEPYEERCMIWTPPAQNGA